MKLVMYYYNFGTMRFVKKKKGILISIDQLPKYFYKKDVFREEKRKLTQIIVSMQENACKDIKDYDPYHGDIETVNTDPRSSVCDEQANHTELSRPFEV